MSSPPRANPGFRRRRPERVLGPSLPSARTVPVRRSASSRRRSRSSMRPVSRASSASSCSSRVWACLLPILELCQGRLPDPAPRIGVPPPPRAWPACRRPSSARLSLLLLAVVLQGRLQLGHPVHQATVVGGDELEIPVSGQEIGEGIGTQEDPEGMKGSTFVDVPDPPVEDGLVFPQAPPGSSGAPRWSPAPGR